MHMQFAAERWNLIDKKKHYGQTSNKRRTKTQNLNVYRLVLQLSLPYSLKPGVKSRMKM